MSTTGGAAPLESVSIRDQVAVLGRRWQVIAVGGFLGLLVAGLYIVTRPTTYTSHAEIVVRPIVTDPFNGSSSTPDRNLDMATEQKIASSGAVADIAARNLGTGVLPQVLIHRHLSVKNPTDTQVLDFAFSDATPAAAQAGAAAFASAYLENRKATAEASINELKGRLTRQIARLEAQGVSNSNPVFTGLAAQLNELNSIDLTPGTVSQDATLPRYRAGPRHSVVAAGGLFIGLILGLVAAFVRDATDDRLRGPQQLAEIFGRPVLARVPVARRGLPWSGTPNLTADGSHHPRVAEAYRTLASRLLVAGATQSFQSLLVVSPAAGEGRSSVSANLATTFVELGYGVWVVSADLRPPQVHRLLGVYEDDDMVDVVHLDEAAAARKSSQELVVHLTEAQMSRREHHLTLVSTARHTPASGRLMSPLVLARVIETNQHVADLTIIDAPPLLEYADAVPLLPRVDTVLVVADASVTRRSELEELADLLRSTDSNVIGCVLNRDGSRVASRRARRALRRLAERRGLRRKPGARVPTYERPGEMEESAVHADEPLEGDVVSGEPEPSVVGTGVYVVDPSGETTVGEAAARPDRATRESGVGWADSPSGRDSRPDRR